VADEVAFTGQSGQDTAVLGDQAARQAGRLRRRLHGEGLDHIAFLCNERRTTVLEFVDRTAELTRR
jgi:hypothetical protein